MPLRENKREENNDANYCQAIIDQLNINKKINEQEYRILSQKIQQSLQSFPGALLSVYQDKVKRYLMTATSLIKLNARKLNVQMSSQKAEIIAISYFNNFIAANDFLASWFHMILILPADHAKDLALSPGDTLQFLAYKQIFNTILPAWLLFMDLGSHELNYINELRNGSIISRKLIIALDTYEKLVEISNSISELGQFGELDEEQREGIIFQTIMEEKDYRNLYFDFAKSIGHVVYEEITSLDKIQDRIKLFDQSIDKIGSVLTETKDFSELLNMISQIYHASENEYGAYCRAPALVCMGQSELSQATSETVLSAVLNTTKSIFSSVKNEIKDKKDSLQKDKAAADLEIQQERERIKKIQNDENAQYQQTMSNIASSASEAHRQIKLNSGSTVFGVSVTASLDNRGLSSVNFRPHVYRM